MLRPRVASGFTWALMDGGGSRGQWAGRDRFQVHDSQIRSATPKSWGPSPMTMRGVGGKGRNHTPGSIREGGVLRIVDADVARTAGTMGVEKAAARGAIK